MPVSQGARTFKGGLPAFHALPHLISLDVSE